MAFVLGAIVLQIVAGIVALVLAKRPHVTTVIGAGGALLGCLLALPPVLRVLLGGAPQSLRLAWDAAHGPFCVELDALGAYFLAPVLVLSALAAVYGSRYLLAYRREKSLGAPWFFFNAFVAAMTTVVLARTVFLFLMAWEVMSVAAYFLVIFEQEKAEARQAGWIFLVATHLGVAFLFAVFLLLGRQAGSLEFDAFRALPALGAGWSGLIFVLALIGFGAKAGLVPFHVWLPEAHPAAPAHVSALMSAVMIKLGLYGLLRVLTFLGEPAAWWGTALACLGLLTALVGIALALQQRDVKRMLAYSSIENMGLMALALGVGLWGRANTLPTLAALSMAAALLHLWNHSLMKGLMFFAAGSVLHATGSKDMERLGGLMPRMPVTAGVMMLGAVAMAALPPLNGFAGKWLIYLGLLRCGLAAEGSSSLVALLAVGLLALVGGLAVLALVRLAGIVLLGLPRSEAAARASEASRWLTAPMLVLVAFCLAIAVIPRAVVGCMAAPLDQVLGARPGQALAEFAASGSSLETIGSVNFGLMIVIAAGALAFRVLCRPAGRARGPTWACGYARPTARMQYTGRSFAEMTSAQVLPRFLRPRTRRTAPRGLFPDKSEFRSQCPDPAAARIYEPLFRRWSERFSRLHVLQQGSVNVYLMYIVLTMVLALAWVSVRTWLGAS